jgi:RNA polymerase sigma factor (sigma-70 family)
VSEQVPSNRELVERVRARDQDAFSAMVERFQRAVVGAALAVTRDPALAEDVAQEAFVAAWHDLRVRDPDRVGPYLAAIARNLARSAARRGARRVAASERGTLPAPDPAPTPHDEVARREDRALVRACLDEVPAAHREALVLFYLEDQSVEQVAQVTGASEALVKQRLSRGRRALKSGVADRLGAALDRARPSRAFTAAVLAATSAAGAREAAAASAAGKVVLSMTMKKSAAAVLGVAIAGGVAWHGVRDGGEPVPSSARPAQLTSAAPPSAAIPATSGAPASGALASRGAPAVRRLPDRGAREELLARIRQAQRQRASRGGVARATPADVPTRLGPPGELDKDYVRSSVRELLPMVRECYEAAREHTPDLGGRIAVTFTIEGEPEIGGVIGSSQIDQAQTTVADPPMLECVQETMYAIEIDPPPGGGVVTVTYPFEFRAVE